ncbi:hypothetical protein B4U80_07563, partial [Leptotrombidium deliense]
MPNSRHASRSPNRGITADDLRTLMQEVVQNQYADTGRKLDTYNGAPHRDVLRWLEEFEDFAGSCNWSDATKINKLPFYLKEAARDWYSSYVTNSSVPPRTWLSLKESLKNYFLPSSYNTYLRDRLHSAVQLPHQPVANYILEKKTLCFKLDPNMSETDIIHHILEGIDPEIAKVIYTANPESVEKLLEVAKNAERGTRNLAARLTREAKSNNGEISEMRQMMIQMSSLLTKIAEEKPSKQKVNFTGINRNFTRNIDGAPQCFNCGKVGHTARFCRFLSQQKQRDNRNNVRFDTHERPNFRRDNAANSSYRNDNRQNFRDNEYRNSARRPNTPVRENQHFRSEHRSPMRPVVTEIDARSTRDTELIYANLKVETMKMRCLIDTGSMVSIVRKDVAETFRKPLRPYEGGSVTSATGNKFTILGEVELNIYLNEYINDRVVVYALVVEDFAFEILLGNDFNRIAGVSVDCANKAVSFRNIACYSHANENTKKLEKGKNSDESFRNKVKKAKRLSSKNTKMMPINTEFTESTSETDSDNEKTESPIEGNQSAFQITVPHGELCKDNSNIVYCEVISQDKKPKYKINERKAIAKMQSEFFKEIKNKGYCDWDKRMRLVEKRACEIKLADYEAFHRKYANLSANTRMEFFTGFGNDDTDSECSDKEINETVIARDNKVEADEIANNAQFPLETNEASPVVMDVECLENYAFNNNSNIESRESTNDNFLKFEPDRNEIDQGYWDYYDMYLDSEYAVDAYNDAGAAKQKQSRRDLYVEEPNVSTGNKILIEKKENECVNVVAITPITNINKVLLKAAVELNGNEEKYIKVIAANSNNVINNVLYVCDKNNENQNETSLKITDDFIVFNNAETEVKVKNHKRERVELASGTCVAQCTVAMEENLKRSKVDATHTTKVPFAGGEIRVGSNLTAEQKDLLLQDLSKFEEIFAFDNKKLGRCNNAEFSIDLIDDKPVRKNPYIYSFAQRKELQKQIDELIELGVVSPSRSPYASPVVLVKKADETYRMCVDMRFLNTKIKDD